MLFHKGQGMVLSLSIRDNKMKSTEEQCAGSYRCCMALVMLCLQTSVLIDITPENCLSKFGDCSHNTHRWHQEHDLRVPSQHKGELNRVSERNRVPPRERWSLQLRYSWCNSCIHQEQHEGKKENNIFFPAFCVSVKKHPKPAL